MSSTVQCSYIDCKSDANGKLLTCSSCSQAFYCGSRCQKSHWPIHKIFCKNVRKESDQLLKRLSSILPSTSENLDEKAKDKIRGNAFLRENSNPGAIEKAAEQLGEHPLVIGGGSIIVGKDGSVEFKKGDVAAIYATIGKVWDGSPRFGLGPYKDETKVKEEDIFGGQEINLYKDKKESEIILCKHKKEWCDICCVDFRPMNDMARLESRNKLAKEARKEERSEMKKGCANPDCLVLGMKKLSTMCSGCRIVAYCSLKCQTLHHSEHIATCKSRTPKFNLHDGKLLKSYPRGTKLEQLFDGQPTGLVCKIIDFSTEGPLPTYFFIDLQSAKPFTINCADAGPLDWIDDGHKMHRSLPEQSWKIWFMEEAPNVPMFSPWGLGPYSEDQIFQRYIKQRPTDLFCQVISCDAPPDQTNMKLTQLKNYSYTVRTCYKSQVFHGNESVFEIECEKIHQSGKWRISF